MNKKAIQLSVNFLVIVLLSLVMLSLGILLIRNFFAATEDIRATLDEQTEAQISLLLEQGKTVAIPINKKVIEQNKYDIFGLGVLNIGGPGTFKVEVSSRGGYDRLNNAIEVDGDDWLLYDDEEFDLSPNEEKGIAILVSVPSDAVSGIYVYDVRVWRAAEQYGSTQKIYVEVP